MCVSSYIDIGVDMDIDIHIDMDIDIHTDMDIDIHTDIDKLVDINIRSSHEMSIFSPKQSDISNFIWFKHVYTYICTCVYTNTHMGIHRQIINPKAAVSWKVMCYL